MNDEEFMNQKAKNMNVDELNKAIEIKSNDCDAINNHPELFEILKGKEWKELNDYYYHNIIIYSFLLLVIYHSLLR